MFQRERLGSTQISDVFFFFKIYVYIQCEEFGAQKG